MPLLLGTLPSLLQLALVVASLVLSLALLPPFMNALALALFSGCVPQKALTLVVFQRLFKLSP
jgi:hypothetical protein